MKNVIFLLSIISTLFACQPNANDEAARLAAAKQIVLDSINQAQIIAQKQKTIDSLKMVSVKTALAKKRSVEKVEKDNPEPMVGSVSKSKKGMNNTTKGALIGVGVGAVTGAAVSKDKVQGAFIGGILGGGAGAGVGAAVDKKKKNTNKNN